MKILRYAQNDSVDIRIGIILKGAAVRLNARSARGWGSLGPCPKRVVFRHEGPLFFGVVPEKGAVSGTGVASVRPDVPKASSQRTRYAEVKKDSVQICRTSIRNRSYVAKIN